LRYSKTWGVMAPGGRSGYLDLIDPKTRNVTGIEGFAADPLYFGGHGQGPTSVDEGAGWLFVTDRTTEKMAVIDPVKKQILSEIAVAASPDYLRFVAATNEVWLTEPDAEQVEIFRLEGNRLIHDALIKMGGGPESLVIDNTHGIAYTHLWAGVTRSIDVRTRA